MATTTRNVPSAPATKEPRRRASWPVDLYRSAVGKKYVMAITGILLMGFVLMHAVGNLKLYLGAEALNHYGEFLRQLLYPLAPKTAVLWAMRVGLLVAFALHIHAAVTLTRMNHHARPIKYQSKRDYIAADFAARTMRFSGVIVALFLLYHLADLTFGVKAINPDFERGLPYWNAVESFSNPLVAAIYIVANLALGMHLFHGAWSLFQSMGWNNPFFKSWRRGFAVAFAALVVAINVSFPIAVLTGVVEQVPLEKQQEQVHEKAAENEALTVTKDANR